MDDVIQVEDRFYILATASNGGARAAVLQRDDTFAVFDRSGDIGALGVVDQGLFHLGTRHLSRFVLRLNGHRPLLLSSRVKDEGNLFGADLTNPDFAIATGHVVKHDLVHVCRNRFLWQGALQEQIRLTSYTHDPIRIELGFSFDADFADIFEVRGNQRPRRGDRLEAEVSERMVRLGYRGLDGLERWTSIEFNASPEELTASKARFSVDLVPHASKTLDVILGCEERRHPHRAPYELARQEWNQANEAERDEWCELETSSERFNHWVHRSASDLRMLLAQTPQGQYPYAGVPWFSTPFGRDGIITALQTVWVNPAIAYGVLAYLAATQAAEVDERRDAEPGKILHETRTSEMARLHEVPFGLYYGSADSTPLFVMLAGAWYERTLDLKGLERLWPHVERALEWIDRWGDADGDGFVEYARRTPHGLVQQGWKDSQDSVFHADGELAPGPIALCEVQAYVYEARVRAARLAEVLGHPRRAQELARQAAELKRAFEEQFWCEELGTYALALDGHKRRCEVVTSNAAHALYTGLASPDRARRVAESVVRDDMFSGWGVRTVSSREKRYNPMSYHNGSVWPHDNGIVAAGLSRYGFDEWMHMPLDGLFEASAQVEGHRLPELFCGFHRRLGEGPTLYPIACSPQAWSAGTVFQFVQSCLRLSIDERQRKLVIDRPKLPGFLTWLRLTDLALPGSSAVSLLFERRDGVTHAEVTEQRGGFEVEVRT
ncbi:MAG: amylo-alpha-1,6-glucosidase [Myxococcaceae bacterium]